MIDLQTYANRIGITISSLKSKDRKMEITTARQVYWYYLHSNKKGFSEIGRLFGVNHATVISGIKRIEGLIEVKDRYIYKYLEAIEYNKNEQ
ncbi:MAG: hypothetical protein FWF52_00480 [Candidatus Azobacteroides sp.]|nr:hypothetical protein [Candidatus Azobacteroides sp.]